MFRRLLAPLLMVGLVTSVSAQQVPVEKIDADMNARIKTEGMDHSKIMWIMHWISDVYGPRPIGSPNHKAAADWAAKTMASWGMKTHLEPFTWRGVGWFPGKAYGFVTAPYKSNVKFEANPWSPSIKGGTITGPVIAIQAPADPTVEEFNKYLETMAPKVKGGIVMNGPIAITPVDFCPTATRTPDSVAKLSYAPRDPNDTTAGRGGRGGRGGGGGAAGCGGGGRGAGGGGRGAAGGGAPAVAPGHVAPAEVTQRIAAMLRDNMPGLLLKGMGGGRIPGEIVAQNGAGQIYNDTTPQPPSVILRQDDYGRMWRVIQDGTPVMASFSMENQFFPSDTSYVTVGEIPGTDKADEVVMLGGHLDSWTSATGATDNGIGSGIMMEAARIITAVGAHPRRTIRVALWSGEEEGELGSTWYVAQHFGSFENQKPDYYKLDAYWNIDGGTGKIHGGSIFGPPAAAAILGQYFAPWSDWGIYGANASSARVSGSTDSGPFDVAGLPGVNGNQDQIEYQSVTWHSNLDTYERIIPDDVMKNATVTASFILGLANRDQMLPRFAPADMPAVPAAGGGRGGRGNVAADPNAAAAAPPPLAAMPRVFAMSKLKPLTITKPGLAVAMGAGGGRGGAAGGGRGGRADPETTALDAKPKHGTVVLNADGSFVYTPKPGYVGTDTFTYKLTRGGETSPEATVTIIVK